MIWFGAIWQPLGQFPQQAYHPFWWAITPCKPHSFDPFVPTNIKSFAFNDLNPCSPSRSTCSPYIGPQGLSDIPQHNCTLSCNGWFTGIGRFANGLLVRKNLHPIPSSNNKAQLPCRTCALRRCALPDLQKGPFCNSDGGHLGSLPAMQGVCAKGVAHFHSRFDL